MYISFVNEDVLTGRGWRKHRSGRASTVCRLTGWLQLRFNCDSTAVRLVFDCSSTALRLLDHTRYNRRTTCFGLLHCGLNE